MSKDVSIKNMEKTKKTSDDTIRTTDSMKEKAHVISRCFISIFKIFRLCRNKNKHGTA